jgi:hypothetical protein
MISYLELSEPTKFLFSIIKTNLVPNYLHFPDRLQNQEQKIASLPNCACHSIGKNLAPGFVMFADLPGN